MATNSGQHGSTLQELADLTGIVRAVADSLRQQDELLRSRGISLPPAVAQLLGQIIQHMSQLERNISNENIELNQLRALAATGALVNSSLDVDDVLATSMDEVIGLAGAERGFIILRNPNSDELEFRISRDNTQKEGAANAPQISMTIVNEVLSTGEALLTDNAYKDPRIQDNMSVSQFILRSVICVPLVQRNKRIGVVYVDNRLRAGVFSKRELNLLTAFANQAAVAIENARFFTRIQASLQEITEIKDVMDSVFASVGSGIITTNADNLVITFNRAAEEILAQRDEDVIGKPLLRILPNIEQADVENELRRVLEEGTDHAFQATVSLPHRAAPAVLSFKFSPLRDAIGSTQGVTVVVDDLTEQSERDAMLNVLQNYLPPGMLRRIHEIAGLDLGGERREVTCMFVETRAFSSFPPNTTPEELMNTINRYLSVATEAIHHNEGVIDKYMGSEVMVLFNTQLNPQPDHAQRAIQTALDVRDAFHQFYAELGIDPQPHFYRVGIHTGIATLGNVGSIYRRNFTAIGDTINLAKRLEENAQYGQIIISEDTRLKLGDSIGGIALEERSAITVKGRQQSTRIYEIFREPA